MKALTIYQPYAELIARGEKRVENRRTSTTHRGPLAIHAAGWTSSARAWWTDEFGIPRDACEFGAIIAVAHLVDCVPVDLIADWAKQHPDRLWILDHPFAAAPFCWIIDNVRRVEPIFCRGYQGLWNVADEHKPLLSLIGRKLIEA